MFLKAHKTKLFIILGLSLLLTGVAFLFYYNKGELVYEDKSFSDLQGWENQDFLKLKEVFQKNCQQMQRYYKNREINESFGTLEQWNSFCKGLDTVENKPELVKTYFEKLSVVKIHTFMQDNSLFTGYYSPLLKGSYTKGGKYQYPLYRTPKDLVSGNLADFVTDDEGYKFKKIFARLDSKTGKIVPYYTRKQIEEGNILSEEDAIVWVDDKIDAFFLQIQGSGTVLLDNGEMIHVGYSSQNGQPYYAIGGYLVENGWVSKEKISLQSIRSFLEKNPILLNDVLYQNPSYVFFDKKEDGPYGAFGIVLEPRHSVAVDRNYIPLGLPLFIQTELNAVDNKFNKMVFAQDIGGAINGEVRADIFFGEGKFAEELSGKQKSSGEMFILSAKNL